MTVPPSPSPCPADVALAADLRAARLVVARFLSLALADPLGAAWRSLAAPGALDVVRAAWAFLADAVAPPDPLAPGEISPAALDPGLWQALRLPERAEAVAAYEAVFGLMLSKECPPYATEYSPQSFSVSRAHALADIAGFYAAFGLEPARNQPERADHITLQLEFVAWLLAKETAALEADPADAEGRAALCRDALRRFADEHLLWWATAFGAAVRRRVANLAAAPDGGERRLAAAAELLAAFVALERATLGLPVPTTLLAPPRPAADLEAPGCEGCCLPGPPAG